MFRLDSEISHWIDHDEIKLGEKLARGGFGAVHKASWRGNEVVRYYDIYFYIVIFYGRYLDVLIFII